MEDGGREAAHRAVKMVVCFIFHVVLNSCLSKYSTAIGSEGLNSAGILPAAGMAVICKFWRGLITSTHVCTIELLTSLSWVSHPSSEDFSPWYFYQVHFPLGGAGKKAWVLGNRTRRFEVFWGTQCARPKLRCGGDYSVGLDVGKPKEGM